MYFNFVHLISFSAKGGASTTNEMCLHMFTYFPRIDNLYMCGMMIDYPAWQKIMQISTYVK